MKKIAYFTVSSLVFLIIISIWFLSTQDRRWDEINYRKIKLEHWQRSISKYIIESNLTPNSLYQYCVDTDKKMLFTRTLMISESDAYHELITDPNLFYREVPYRFLKGNDNWYVMETEGNKYFQDKFMIDKKGNIYIVSSD